MLVRNLFIMSLFVSSLFAKKHFTEERRPNPYRQFDAPIESIAIAKQYLPEDPIIVEAGAYDGNESCALAKLWPKGHVYCFEPVERLFNITSDRVRGISNISAYKLGLGETCGKKTMYLSTEEGQEWVDRVSMSSSFYPPKEHLNYSGTLFQGTEEVEMITLDHWSEIHGIEKVDMLWLDMQGYELPALKAATTLLKGVSVILTELEFAEAYEGQPLYREVKDWLDTQGFVLIGGNFDFPDNAQFFGDGLFVRKELLLP
ncbi:MAG TPA: FkbM family methyltransferase [Chlamydiales bacterium]|nr:FkbM family methyltransferase [Chlamydiales bacterium]